MSKVLERPTMSFRAACLDCRVFHDPPPLEPGTAVVREMTDWELKHRGHRIEFSSRARQIPKDLDDSIFERLGKAPWWLDPLSHGLRENTNFQFVQQTGVNMTFTTLDSLATDTNLLAGASSLAIDNGATGCPLEIGVSGYIKNHSVAPTVSKEIDVYAYAAIDDTPTYPDTLLGTDALKTLTTANIVNSGLKLLVSMVTAATASQVNPFSPVALSSCFGVMPRYWSVWVVHNSGQIIAASGNRIATKGIYVAG